MRGRRGGARRRTRDGVEIDAGLGGEEIAAGSRGGGVGGGRRSGPSAREDRGDPHAHLPNDGGDRTNRAGDRREPTVQPRASEWSGVDAVKPSIAFFDVGAAANGRDLRATRHARLTGAEERSFSTEPLSARPRRLTTRRGVGRSIFRAGWARDSYSFMSITHKPLASAGDRRRPSPLPGKEGPFCLSALLVGALARAPPAEPAVREKARPEAEKRPAGPQKQERGPADDPRHGLRLATRARARARASGAVGR